MTADDLGFRLETILATHDFGDDGSHDIHHLRRVRDLAIQIMQIEGEGDPLVLTAAAYLHDIVNLPKDHPERHKASRMAADMAGLILLQAGLDADRIAQAQHAILTHSYSAGFRPETIEAKIIQDADRQEAIGAIGIARAFYVAGRMGSALFDPEDPLAKNRPLDDKTFALDHFTVKLFALPDLMQSRGGRALAEERVTYMRSFVEQLLREI